MELITDNTRDFSKTHTHFFAANILIETEKAFRIKVLNRKGAQTTVWIPKSRCCYQVITPDPKQPTVTRTKYYAPNFFVK